MNARPLRTLALALTTLTAGCAGNSTGSTGSAGTSGGTAGTTGAGGTTSTDAGGTAATGAGGTTSTGVAGITGAAGAGGTLAGGGGQAGTGAGAGAATGTAGTPGAATFCPPGSIFCADFEEASGVPTNNPVGTATFEDPSEYGMTFGTVMALDYKTAPHDGNQSLKIDPSSSFSIRTLAVSVPATFWVRLYVKSDQAIGQQEHNSFFAAGLGPDYSSAKNVEVSEQFGCILLNASDTLYPTGTTCGANTALSANTWHCMAAEFDGTTGNVQVFAGATQIINAVGFKSAQESFNTFSFGYFSYNPPSGNPPPAPPNVWFDDVVVSASPLSCP